MSLTLKIITPEKKVFEGDVESVKCPGLDGLFGVLTGHAPMVSALGEGTLSYEAGGQTKDVKISGGFLEVSNNVCSIMADSAE